jgi:hypothetical protein
MSLTTSVQGWLGSLGPREGSALTARSHIAAETSTDVDAICATVSPDVFFALPVRTRAGHELRDGSVLVDADQVRSYYAGRSGSYVVRASSQLKSITTDWYAFNETAATLLGTGRVGEVDATGIEWVVRSIVLFPTAPDGIRGEICATRHPMDDVLRGVAVDGGDEVANGALLDRLSLALRDGRSVADELAAGHTLAVRLDDPEPSVRTAAGAEEAARALAALFEGAEDVTMLVRVATDWYLFAEYLVPLAHGVRHVALIQPIEDGRITGTYGYGCRN